MSKILMLLFAFIFLASSSVVMFMPVQAASEDSWASKTSMSTERRNFGVVVVNGKIYAVGGVDGLNETYDPKTDTWTTKEPMPTARSNLGIAVVQDKIYTIGGDDTGLNEVYDSTTDQWTAKTAMSTPRSGLNPHAIEGKIYVIGGMFSGANADAAVFYDINEVYDPKTDTWRTGTPIPTPVAGYASVVVDKQIYLIGGLTANWDRVNLTQIYNPSTDTWSTGEPIPTIVGNSEAGATTGVSAPKKIYVIGGTIGPIHVTIPDLTCSIQVTNIVQIYDPTTDEWSTGTQMPTARAGLSVAVVDDILYVIGGGNVSPAGLAGSDFGTNEQYTPEEYTQTSSPVSTPTLESQQTEQFPTTLVVVVLGIVAVVSVGLLAYFRKRNR